MNSRRDDFWMAALIGLAVCFGMSSGIADAVAQDWLRPTELWSSRSPILRGQEPELGEAREVENPFEKHIETDRDSFTPSTRTVETGRWIVESSYSFIDNRHVAETHSFPELLLRFGLTERIELRFGGNYEVGGEGGDVSGGSGSEGFGEEAGKLVRESQLLYGLKARLSDQVVWRPESSVILQGHTPTSGPDPATAFTPNVEIGVRVGWGLNDEAARFFSNAGIGWRF